MIFSEHFMGKERSRTFQGFADRISFRDVVYLLIVLSGGNGENGKQHINGCNVRCFVNTETYVSVLVIPQINFLAKSNRANLLCGNVFGQFKTQCVEILCIYLRVTEFLQLLVEKHCDTVDAGGNGRNSFLSVVDCIEACHCGQQSLCRAYI